MRGYVIALGVLVLLGWMALPGEVFGHDVPAVAGEAAAVWCGPEPNPFGCCYGKVGDMIGIRC